MWHVLRRRRMYADLWQGNLKQRDHLEDVGVDGRIIIKWISNTLNGGAD
jgi:hypothetical protein